MDAHTNMSTNGHINFTEDVDEPVKEEIEDSHTNIYTNGYDVSQYEYKFLSIKDDMSTNDFFQEQSCENNTMEEPSAVEEPKILEDAFKASTTTTDLVNDKAQSQLLQVKIFAHKMKL